MLVRETSGMWLQPHSPAPPTFNSHPHTKSWFQVFFSVQVAIVQLRETFIETFVLITSEFSQPPRWGSLCVCVRRPHSGNRRDSRVCRSNGGWRRTGCHSDSRNLKEKTGQSHNQALGWHVLKLRSRRTPFPWGRRGTIRGPAAQFERRTHCGVAAPACFGCREVSRV